MIQQRTLARALFTFAAGVLLLSCNVSSAAGDELSKSATVVIRKVMLFKNGLGFVVSDFSLPDGARTVRIGQLPIPMLGTFWVGYPAEVRFRNITTSMEVLESEQPVQSLGQLLQVNAGRKVLVHTSERDIEGTVLPGAESKGKADVPSPYLMSPRGSRNPGTPSIVPEPATVLFMKTERSTVALNPGSVLRAEFTDGDPVRTARLRLECPALWMNLEKPAGGERVAVSYLARGITWVPGYLVDLSDPKTARFSAHAVVINEMADLSEVKLLLVSGFPNIRFGGTASPVSKSQSLDEFLRSLAGGGTRSGVGDYTMMQQAVMVNAPAVEGLEERALVPGYSTAEEGEVAEDLYFYPVKTLTLRKDETAWLPLFTADMPYRHIYTWKIRDFVDSEDRYQADRTAQDRTPGEEIWHSCRLTNTLSMPLTTAAAEFLTNDEFTGQDISYYTPPKAETTIRINKALNITAEKSETEIERKRDVAMIHGYHYDLVKVQGDLNIRNHLAKDASIEITKQLSGEVIEKGPNSTDTKTAEGLKKVNPKHILTWLVDLKAGEQRKLSYIYQVYIRD